MKTITLPTLIPSTKKTPNCIEVEKGIYLPMGQSLDLITLARIAHLQFPSYIVGGAAALRYAGCQLELGYVPINLYGTTRLPNRRHNIHFRRARPGSRIVRPDPAFPNLRVADPNDATVDCLKLIESGHAHWHNPSIPGFTPIQVRQLQLVDALRCTKLIKPSTLKTAAHNRFSAKRLEPLISESDPGAGSPRETLLRLIVRDLADWESQVELFSPNGKRITTADLALPDLMVALFYDGEHHLQRGQRDYDSQALALLKQMGWRVFRVTSGMLDDPNWVIAHTNQLIAEARAERATIASAAIHRPRKSSFARPQHID